VFPPFDLQYLNYSIQTTVIAIHPESVEAKRYPGEGLKKA